MDRPTPSSRPFSRKGLLALVMVSLLLVSLTVDAGNLRRTLTMLTSIKLRQVREILRGW